MDYPEDPWNTPDLHKNHNHPPGPPIAHPSDASIAEVNGHSIDDEAHPASPQQVLPTRTTSTFTTGTVGSSTGGSTRRGAGSVSAGSPSGWGYFDAAAGSFNEPPAANPGVASSPFGAAGNDGGREPGAGPVTVTPSRTIGGSGRTGSAIEENIVVTLMPEKEGMFLFQHHNYEVSGTRRGSKVIRRYSDFVWLLDCLQRRYPFRVLPLLPPKRVAGKLDIIRCSYLDARN
jgi:sorting nexin-8